VLPDWHRRESLPPHSEPIARAARLNRRDDRRTARAGTDAVHREGENLATHRDRQRIRNGALCRALTLLLIALLAFPAARPAGATNAAPAALGEDNAPGATGATTFRGQSLIVARRADGGVWVRKTDGLWYSGWSPLGGATDAAPAAASTETFVAVFVRGTDGTLWVRRSGDGNEYEGWRALGDRLASPPAAAASGGQVHVFLRDERGMIWQRNSTDGRTFSAARPLGGPLAAAPVAVTSATGVTLYGQGTDGRRYTLDTRDGAQATAWGDWTGSGASARSASAAPTGSAPLTLDIGVNFIDPSNWQTYQLPAYTRLRPTLAKFSMFYDGYPATPVFGTAQLDDAITAGARTIILRTAETRTDPDEVERQLNAPLPGDGRSLLDYIRDRGNDGSGVAFWIEVGNEPDLAGVNPLIARYSLLATVRDLGPQYRASHPNLHWMASLPTANGLRDSANPDYRGLAYLDLFLSDRGDGLGSVAARYDALGAHLYGADTLEQPYPALREASDTRDCAGANGDALCPDLVLDRALSQTGLPIFITEAGINSAMRWDLKARYYLDAMYRMPARVRGFALFTLSLDPEWYAGASARCLRPSGASCTRYALDVDERGLIDPSFAGANTIGLCAQLGPGDAACVPPCASTAAAENAALPRSAVQRASCTVDAQGPPTPAPHPPEGRDRTALLPAARARRWRRGARYGDERMGIQR